MEWIIFNKDNLSEYEKFINLNPYTGIWHDPLWLEFQINSGKAVSGGFFGTKKNRLIFTQIESIIPVDDNFNNIIKNKKNHKINTGLPIPSHTNMLDLTR